MLLFVTGNLHQQRISFFNLEPFVQAQQSGWLEENSADSFDSTSQIFNGHYLLRSSFLKGCPDKVTDMIAASHVLCFVTDSFLVYHWVLFFIGPFYGRSLFLTFFVVREEVVNHGRSANFVSVSHHLKSL